MSTDRNRTTVINVRGHKPADLLSQPDFVYVGRAVPRRGWKASIWENSHRMITGIRDAATAVELYRKNIKESIQHPHARRLLGLLRGKRLGCWCCDWDGIGEPDRPCHAVVLARLADGLPTDATDSPPLSG